MMRATTRPRRSSGARSAAKGIITWPATEATPDGHRGQGEEPQARGEGAGHQGDGGDAEEPGDQRRGAGGGRPAGRSAAARRRSRPGWP